ncbi:MAG: hypothetical protein QOI64_135 [Solirubrobacteraceae bacterium]|nr:hypothetical protein [Solirubrobacteraceae bacterium]
MSVVTPDIGSPRADAQSDFARARRRRSLALLSARLRGEPDDVAVILPFEEVVEALGRAGERSLGLQMIDVDSIVGTVDRTREFDRDFRPTTPRMRERWERIAEAQRRGESMPPIDVYRVGDLHFVRDGHHRVSVARAQGLRTIEAYVTEVITRIPPPGGLRIGDLALKSHERLFSERVPLAPEASKRIQLSDEWRYAALAEGVEAWGFRYMQGRGEFMTRERVAEAWFQEEYVPVVELLREAGLIGRGTEAEAYMRVSALRYLLLRTHAWDDEVVERLRVALEHPGPDDEDTLVHQLRAEISRSRRRP